MAPLFRYNALTHAVSYLGLKLTEMVLPEEKVLEKLNAVSTAKRLANMVRSLYRIRSPPLTSLRVVVQELHDSDFGKREEIHKIKRAKRTVDAERA